MSIGGIGGSTTKNMVSPAGVEFEFRLRYWLAGASASSRVLGLLLYSLLTGPVSAIISSAGDWDKHYVAGVMVALFALLFGIFAPLVTRLMLAVPKAFIATLAGLALLRVLERAFAVSFRGGFTLGATVCFLVTVANVPILSIGAPFWAVLIGLAVSWALERADFKRLEAAPTA
jgi:benzoate membrane transport protein